MSDFHVVRLLNPGALELPVLKELFDRAFTAVDFVPSPDRVRQWCYETLHHPDIAVLLIRTNERFVGICVIDLDPGIWSTAAQVIYTWMPAVAQEAMDMLSDAIAELCRERGVKRAWVLNQSPHDDEEYLKRLSHGGPGRVLCSVLEFDISAPESVEEE